MRTPNIVIESTSGLYAVSMSYLAEKKLPLISLAHVKPKVMTYIFHEIGKVK